MITANSIIDMIEKQDKVKVVVGMSGGVDSSVAVALLKQQGCQVTGVTMRIWDGEVSAGEGIRHGCYGPGEAEDIEDACRVAHTLGVPIHVFDLRQEYQHEVLDYFRREYLAGRTPNPCLKCNRKIKFDTLLRKARDSGIDFDNFATGHYARVACDESNHRYLLKKARDLSKDQSYFISSLSQEQLGQAIFPLGDYTKDEVRKMAADFGLDFSSKPESQDFIAGGYSALLTATPSGPIMDKNGQTLGEHRGITSYTIGQRRGLSISATEPLYVTAIDAAQNAIIVGSRKEVYGDDLFASDLNWIAIEALTQPARAKAKIRYQHQAAWVTIIPWDEGLFYVKFDEPQMAITPGQAVVFYQEDVVLGSGTIERAGTPGQETRAGNNTELKGKR
ncbi:tRNA 2-thiouridine(34) synthase MnmA [Chloroflexota bacterium]